MTVTEVRPTSVLGQRLLRREDPALLTGEAKFTNDLVIPGALHLAVLRSPYAHARITAVDVSAAAAMPGVVAAYSGADLASLWGAPMPCAWPVTADMKNPAHYPLAVSKANTFAQLFLAAVVLADTGFVLGLGTLRLVLVWLTLGLTLASLSAYTVIWVRHMTGDSPG